jgi:hypothetical protein
LQSTGFYNAESDCFIVEKTQSRQINDRRGRSLTLVKLVALGVNSGFSAD